MANVKFVPPRVPLVDLRSGQITREWYLLFASLFPNSDGSGSIPDAADDAGPTSFGQFDCRTDEMGQQLVTAPSQDLGPQITAFEISQATAPPTPDLRQRVDEIELLATGAQPFSANLTSYATGNNPSRFTLGIVGSIDAAAWRTAIGAGTSSTAGTVTSVDVSGGTTGLTTSGGPVTGSGTITIAGTLGIANGGTGSVSSTANYLVRGNGTAAYSPSVVYDDGVGIGVGQVPGFARIRAKGVNTAGTDFAFYGEDSAGTLLFATRNDGLFYTGLGAQSPYNRTTAVAANLVANSAGYLERSTSSIRYKKDVRNYTRGIADIMRLRPVFYRGRSESDKGQQFAGLVAEEVLEAGLSEFVALDAEGRADALHYANMLALAFKGMQDQQRLIEELRAEVDGLLRASPA